MVDKVRMTGLREMGAAFKELNNRLQKRIGRSAVSAGGRVLQKEAKAQAPVLKEPHPHRKAGTVKAATRVKATAKRNGSFEARVWVKGIGTKKIAAFKQATGRNSSQNPDDPFYWWMVHFGTAKVPANPWMSRAFDSKKLEAAKKIADQLGTRLEAEAADVGRTTGKVK